MTERTLHPDFLAAHEGNRWGGPLQHLAAVLKHDAYQRQGEWAWRILSGGALVSMRVPPTFQKELRIARRLRKAFTDKSAAAWHTELKVFTELLGCTGWKCISDVVTPAAGDQPAKLEAIYQEVTPLSAKASLTCARCGNQFDSQPTDKVYREPLCQSCAVKLGTEDAAALAAKRGA